METQRLNDRYSWFKHVLDDDFRKHCLNFVEIIGPECLDLNNDIKLIRKTEPASKCQWL